MEQGGQSWRLLFCAAMVTAFGREINLIPAYNKAKDLCGKLLAKLWSNFL